jgi:hypothetical protein
MRELISWLFGLLGTWWIWLPVVFVLLYLTVQNHRRIKRIDTLAYKLLSLEVPKDNDKKEIAAEQLFASLHSIVKSKRELISEGGIQEHVSFEIASIDKQIHFFVWVPEHLQGFVESQITAQYSGIQIHDHTEDYAQRELDPKTVVHTSELVLTQNDVLPLKTYEKFDTDPLVALTVALSKLEQDEEIWVQILTRPTADDLQKKSSKYIRKLRSGVHVGTDEILDFFIRMVQALWQPPQAKGPSELSERDRARVNEVEQKSSKPSFQVKIRLAYVGKDKDHYLARQRLQGITTTFRQFNNLNGNGFEQKHATFDHEGLAAYRARFFIDKGYMLNTEELATLFHLPHSEAQVSNVTWADAKAIEAPANLPVPGEDPDTDSEISLFAMARFNKLDQQFGIYRRDRNHHVYITGLKGGGKTKLLELLALSDLYQNQGYAIIDPHGDFAASNLHFIPPSRINDVIYFNATDTEFPIAFNPLSIEDPAHKTVVSSELINVFKKQLFQDSWQPQLEYILRYIILALFDYPGATLLDIPRMLNDEAFRAAVIEHISDPIILNFWKTEFSIWQERFMGEVIAPISQRISAFTANPLVRNIIAQPKTNFSFREMMDSGKIFIANLASSRLGEENTATLGALLLAHLHAAGMSRLNHEMTMPSPLNPYYLYIDDFEHFTTDSFAIMLAEAGKYGMNITITNPRPSQIAPAVREAVFSDIGTIIAFRLHREDATVLNQYFASQFDEEELASLQPRSFIASMMIDGGKTNAFSGTTLSLPTPQQNYISYIVDHTRQTYAQHHVAVENLTRRKLEPRKTPVKKREDPNGGEKTSALLGHTITRASTTPTAPPRDLSKVISSWQQSTRKRTITQPERPLEREKRSDDEVVFRIRR